MDNRESKPSVLQAFIGTASTGTGNFPPEGKPGPLKDGIDAGGGNGNWGATEMEGWDRGGS